MTDEQVNELFEELKWAKIEAGQAHAMVRALQGHMQDYIDEAERLRDALLDIIALQPDPEFGAVPIKTAQDIAINALDMK